MEEEARQKAEEERIKAAREEEARINKQAEDAFAIIGDLDNALKGFTETLGLSDVIKCTAYMCVHVVLKARHLGGSEFCNFIGWECLSRHWMGFP